MTPKGSPLPSLYSETRWGWSCRFNDKRDFFDEVSNLLQKLLPHRQFLEEIVDSGGRVEAVVHLPGDVNIGSTLDWKQCKILAELRVDLGVEVFPHSI